MTPKEYLSQYKETVMEIKGIEKSIESLRTQATSVTVATDGDRVQSSGNKDKIGAIACQIADLDKEKERLSEKLTHLTKLIDKVPDAKYRTLLRYRYIALYSWDRITKEMGYEKSWILRLHGEALNEVGILLK